MTDTRPGVMVNPSQRPPLPVYKCHKLVQASQILQVEGLFLVVADYSAGPLEVTYEWINRHHPKPGDYFVRYDDGYCSVSPAKAFEEGYARVDDDAARRSAVGGINPGLEPLGDKVFGFRNVPSADRSLHKIATVLEHALLDKVAPLDRPPTRPPITPEMIVAALRRVATRHMHDCDGTAAYHELERELLRVMPRDVNEAFCIEFQRTFEP